jgi:hypothetical protein
VTKQVYELTAADLEREAVWVFPMDESVEDEASVRPLRPGEVVPDGIQRIVRAVFEDATSKVFPGYIYPGSGGSVEDTRPVAWCGNLCITFWNGMIEPSRTYLDQIKSANIQWPLTYETDAAEAANQAGSLNGVYYLDGDSIRCVGW